VYRLVATAGSFVLHDNAITPPLSKVYDLTAEVERLPNLDHVLIAEIDAQLAGVAALSYEALRAQRSHCRAAIRYDSSTGPPTVAIRSLSGRLFPKHERLQRAARVLAPPVVVRKHPAQPAGLRFVLSLNTRSIPHVVIAWYSARRSASVAAGAGPSRFRSAAATSGGATRMAIVSSSGPAW
jgi:hypothetical protein